MLEILLPVLGFFIGAIASLTGIGGGAFIVPLLTLFYGFAPATAVGTSLTSIIFTGIASALNYAKQKRIYYRTGLALAVTTVPGAFLGAYLTTILPARTLALIFGVFIILVAIRMIISLDDFRKRPSKQEHVSNESASEMDRKQIKRTRMILLAVGLSFFGGLASGLLGIGGGVLLVPIMIFVLGMPIHFATATSMFTIIFTSISGVTEHYLANQIDITYALLLALGTVFGAQLGAYTSKRISGKTLRRIFGILLIVVSLQMILKYL